MTEEVKATDRSVDGSQRAATEEKTDVFGGRVLTLIIIVLIFPIAVVIGPTVWFLTCLIERLEDLRYRRRR